MNLTYLGTAAAEGWPGIFCRCEFCERAKRLGGRDIRTRSQALLDDALACAEQLRPKAAEYPDDRGNEAGEDLLHRVAHVSPNCVPIARDCGHDSGDD